MIKRPAWSHKGDFGHVLVVGGSPEYTGSPVLNGLAAYAAGCDLVTIAAPEQVAWAINAYSPDLITRKLPGGWLNLSHVHEIAELARDCDSLLIGGGLSHRQETLAAVEKIVNLVEIPVVMDADALRVRIPEGAVITPHAGEFERAFGSRPSTDVAERKKSVEVTAREYSCTILLKGHIDIVSDGRRTVTSKKGNPYMTVGGTGDTLAGILASLLAREVKPFDAAVKAARINGKAGGLCLKKEKRVLASHLIDHIPFCMK